MIAPARAAALQVLQGVGANRSDLPAAIARARDRLTDPRDRALLVELATGTLRWRGAIDHLIAHASKRPLHRLDEQILDILRLGIYQLLHLNRVPAAAVVPYNAPSVPSNTPLGWMPSPLPGSKACKTLKLLPSLRT